MNGHIGRDTYGLTDIMGRHGIGERNEAGDQIISLAQDYNLVILNTYFQKDATKKVTYSSGGHNTQVDYILCRRSHLKTVVDCTVLPGECVAKQHKPVVCKMSVGAKRRTPMKGTPKTRWWKLNDETCTASFVQEATKCLKMTVKSHGKSQLQV